MSFLTEDTMLSLTDLASQLLDRCSVLESPPTSTNGSSSTLSSDRTTARQSVTHILETMTRLIQGPQYFLHEFVASNWDHGALYAALQTGVFDHIMAAENRVSVTVGSLEKKTNVPKDKLERILGLLHCKHILAIDPDWNVSLTAESEEILRDQDYRSWIEFQYVNQSDSFYQQFCKGTS